MLCTENKINNGKSITMRETLTWQINDNDNEDESEKTYRVFEWKR